MILISKKSQERRQKAIERGTYSAASASPPIERNCSPPASGQKELYCPIIYHGPSASDGAKKLIEPIEFHGPPPSDGAKKLIEPIEFHGPPPSGGAKKLIEPIEFHGPPPSGRAKKLIEPIEFHERPNTSAPAESPPSVPSCADNAAQQPPSNSYDFDLRQMIDYKPQAADAAREERNRSAMIAALSPRTLDGVPLAPPPADVIVKAQIPVFRPPVSPSPENPYNPIVFASEFENGKIPDDLEYVEGYAKTTTLPNGESHIQTFFADPVRNLTPEQQYALEVGLKMLHTSAPKQERPPDPSPADNAYLSGGVGMVIDRPEEGCLFVDGKNGLLRLTNFRVLAAESRLVIGKNASAEPAFEYVLRIICGPITTDITLAPNELENAQRKIQNSVPSCIVHPVHPKANPLLVNFIRQQLAAVPQKTVVQRTGFLKLNGVWQYVHDGAVPPAATVFDTGKYIPDDRRVTDVQTFHNAVSFLDISSKDELIIPLWLLAHLGPLFQLFHEAGRTPRFVTVLFGRSGSLKTSASLILFRLFQNQGQSPTASFRDTETAMEIKLGELNGSVGIFDDLRPPVSSGFQSKGNIEKFEAIIRAVGDHVAKARSNTKLGKAKEFIPSGCAIVTAEDLAGSQSSLLRSLCLSISKGDIDGAKLRYFQNNPDLITTHMSRFLAWVGAHGGEMIEHIRNDFPNHLFEGMFAELRLVDTAATLMITADILCYYAQCIGAMKVDEAQSLLTRCTKAIINAVLMSESISKEANPCIMYLDAFFRLVERGEIRLAENIKTYLPEVHDGFLADQTAWVDYNEVYAKVTRYYNRLNVTFPLKEQQLAIHLADAELIEVTYEDRDGRSRRHYTQKSSLPTRKRMQVLHLDRAQSYLEENANN